MGLALLCACGACCAGSGCRRRTSGDGYTSISRAVCSSPGTPCTLRPPPQAAALPLAPPAGESRGFAFINFIHREDALRAISKLDGFGCAAEVEAIVEGIVEACICRPACRGVCMERRLACQWWLVQQGEPSRKQPKLEHSSPWLCTSPLPRSYDNLILSVSMAAPRPERQ